MADYDIGRETAIRVSGITFPPEFQKVRGREREIERFALRQRKPLGEKKRKLYLIKIVLVSLYTATILHLYI